MPKEKVRFYDTLTEEDIDIFGYFADMVVLMLYQRMLQYKILFNSQSATTKKTSRMVAWLLYRENRDELGLKESSTPYKAPKSSEQVYRSRMVAEILDEILPETLQDEEYVDACRKVLSIMSVRTWEERKQREALKNSLPPKLVSRKPRPSLPERRQKWIEVMGRRKSIQSDMGLKGATSAVNETPITSLPTQVTPPPETPSSHTINLVMPLIMAEADHECKKGQDQYSQEFVHIRRIPRRRRVRVY